MMLTRTDGRRALLGIAAASLVALGFAAPAIAIPPGERDVKVVITKFADQGAYPYTAQQAREAMFEDPDGNASGFFEALTGGEVSLNGADQVERVGSTVNRGQVGNCNDLFDVLQDIVNQLDDPLGEHDHLVVVGPRVAASCSRSGVAGIGPPGGAGEPGLNWVYLNGRLTHEGESNWRLVAHELTHNLGANHAGACTGPFPAGACNGNDYGDVFDIMGASTGALAGFPSSWHQARIGVLGPANVETVTGDGTYTLTTANDPARAGVKLLMVPRGGGRPFYALETRTRGAYDDFLALASRLYNGVTVRLAVGVDAPYTPGPENDTRLVRANPAENPRNWPLLPCEAFTDPGSAVSIRPVEVDGGVAQVQVALEGRPLADDPVCGSGDISVASARLLGKKRQRQRGRRIRVTARARAGEAARVRLRGRVKAAGKAYNLRPRRARLAAGEPKALTLTPRRAAHRKRIARALRRGKRVKAPLKGTFTDDAGNRARRELVVRLR